MTNSNPSIITIHNITVYDYDLGLYWPLNLNHIDNKQPGQIGNCNVYEL